MNSFYLGPKLFSLPEFDMSFFGSGYWQLSSVFCHPDLNGVWYVTCDLVVEFGIGGCFYQFMGSIVDLKYHEDKGGARKISNLKTLSDKDLTG